MRLQRIGSLVKRGVSTWKLRRGKEGDLIDEKKRGA